MAFLILLKDMVICIHFSTICLAVEKVLVSAVCAVNAVFGLQPTKTNFIAWWPVFFFSKFYCIKSVVYFVVVKVWSML